LRQDPTGKPVGPGSPVPEVQTQSSAHIGAKQMDLTPAYAGGNLPLTPGKPYAAIPTVSDRSASRPWPARHRRLASMRTDRRRNSL